MTELSVQDTHLLIDWITLLCNAKGVSGDEDRVSLIAEELLRPYCKDVHIAQGNVTGTLDCGGKGQHILLDAHSDQIGFIVTGITDDGFVTVGNIGGLDRRLLPAQRVTLHGTHPLHGVVCSMPPHLNHGKEEVQAIADLRIDVGLSKSSLEQVLAPGDAVSFASEVELLLGTRITAPSLDDRCGIVAILYALELLQRGGERYDARVTVLFSTQEEVGERGARIGAYTANPDIALAVDVSFAKTLSDKDGEVGEMGRGAMIGIAPTLSREVSNALLTTAREWNIPFQYEVMNGTTGTNADQFSVCRGGIKACTVSIPLRYMHTPSEIIDLVDVAYTGRLLAEYIRRFGTC